MLDFLIPTTELNNTRSEEQRPRINSSIGIKSFVSRNRTLSARRENMIRECLPKFAMPKDLCSGTNTINLEIGFGTGGFIAENALSFKDELFIGCEPFKHGIATLLDKIQEHGIQNILIWPNDARVLMQTLPDQAVDNLFILFPDPWPRPKHHKRRLISKEFLELAYTKLKKNGSIYIATDHQGYASWIENVISSSDKFERDIKFDSNKSKYLKNINTNYKAKALAKNSKIFFYLVHTKLGISS